MSSIVCQGLQSCLEPRLVEPLVLRHKLAQSPCMLQQQEHLENSQSEENKNSKSKSNDNSDLGGWSFMQALSITSNNTKEVTEKEVYVHPLVKRSSSTLSTKSLEMCTESLGSETGSEISESSDELSSLSSESHKFQAIQPSKSLQFTKKLNHRGIFPPPLSSISGSDCVQVRPHREDGRLVMKAVTVSSPNTCFQAERVDGRLRLSLLKDCSLNDDDDDDDDDHGEYENVGCEIGIGEIPRPRRCKESGCGNEGMSNWEPFWVAIS
uniref:FAF domain-containing protein n=1 Tax=Davidia involucrata TaxID=16924 RepID=A0A5B7AC38_DAVIN